MHAAAASVHRRARPLLGTFVEIACHGDGTDCASAIDAAFAAIARIHALMSPQDAESDVSRMNARAHLEPVAIDRETAFVLRAALELHRDSAGAFDVCAASGGNSADIRIERSNRVRFARPVCIDLGGIAKGYAVDRAVDVLRDHGIARAVVNAGADLRVLGDRSELVHVRDPVAPSRLLPALRLAQGAAATSAGYFSRTIVDPASGALLAGGDSASVMAPTAMIADALAKVVLLRGAACGALLRSYNAHALVLTASSGTLRARWLPELPA